MKKSPGSKKASMRASAEKPVERNNKKDIPHKKEPHFGGVIHTPSGTIEENVEEQSP
ncbi:hypothetical protein [Bdellovibrio sp. BCCA]|uniref:hypothetical protein n=1 Tax=Bdellovibrio sp. BCCA TaxID=3136281 RepID=UPI0030F21027